MRYLVKQRLFTFRDSFCIKSEFGQDIFQVKSQMFSIGNKLYLCDMYGDELIYIEQKLFKFLPAYELYRGEALAAKVQKEFSFFKPKFNIDSVMGNFTLEGDWFDYNFSIKKNGYTVATISKQMFSFSDTYMVEVDDNEDQPFIMALVIVIDQVLHDNSGNSN